MSTGDGCSIYSDHILSVSVNFNIVPWFKFLFYVFNWQASGIRNCSAQWNDFLSEDSHASSPMVKVCCVSLLDATLIVAPDASHICFKPLKPVLHSKDVFFVCLVSSA